MPDMLPEEGIFPQRTTCVTLYKGSIRPAGSHSITPSSLGPQKLLLSNAYNSSICLKPQDPTVNIASGSDVLHFDTTLECVPRFLENSSPSVQAVTQTQRESPRGSQPYLRGSPKDSQTLSSLWLLVLSSVFPLHGFPKLSS